MKIKRFFLALGLTTIGSAASIFLPIATLPANALTWTLNNVAFGDGGTATGTFDYNATNNTYSNINVSVTGPLYNGAVGSTGNTVTFAPGNENVFGTTSPSTVSVCYGAICALSDPYFTFAFNSPLTNAGGSVSEVSPSRYGVLAGLTTPATSSPAVQGSFTAVPFEFNPGQGILLGLPSFIAFRTLKKRKALKKSNQELQEIIN